MVPMFWAFGGFFFMRGKIFLKLAELPIDLKFQLLEILGHGENQ